MKRIPPQLITIVLLLILSQLACGKSALPVLVPNGENFKNFKNLLIPQKIHPSSISISSNSKLIASNGPDHTIQIWDTDLGKLISSYTGHSDTINTLAFSPDGKIIASGSKDETIRLWNVKSGETINTLKAFSGAVNTLVFSPDSKVIASGGDDNTIRLWNIESGNIINTLIGHSGPIKALAYSPDGKVIVSGSNDQTIWLWNISSGEQFKILRGHSDWVSTLAFSPDGNVIVSGSYDTSIRLWNAQSGEFIKALKGHSNWVNSVAFSPDGKVIASGSGGILSSEDNTIRLWNAQSGEIISTLQGHLDNIYALAFTPDGRFIVSGGSGDGTIRLWNSQSGEATNILRGHTASVYKVAYSPDGKIIASSSIDEYIRLWDSVTGKNIHTLTGNTNFIATLAFSPDGNIIASNDSNNSFRLWNVLTGEVITTLKRKAEAHGFNYVRSIVFSPDGKIIASASNDDTISLWNAHSFDLIKTIESKSNSANTLTFSPDGKLLATEGEENTIRIMDTSKFTPKVTLKGHSEWINAIVFSPNSKTIATGSNDKTIRLWDVESGEIITTIEGHSGAVKALAFSPDGKIVASGSNDNLIGLWDVESGENIYAYGEHYGPVTTLAFSPDGNVIASGSHDRSIQLWNVQSGTMIKKLIGGVNGNWLSHDRKGNFQRGDNGTMLMVDTNGNLSPAIPKSILPVTDRSLSVQYLGDEISLKSSHKESISLLVTNNSQQPMLWITPKLLDSKSYILHNLPSIPRLEVGESAELKVIVSAFLPYSQAIYLGHELDKPETNKDTLKIAIITPSQKKSNFIDIPIEVISPKVKLISTNLLDSTLKVAIKNIGEVPISSTRFNLSLPEFPKLILDEQSAEASIEPGDILERVFVLPEDFIFNKKNNISLQVRTSDLPFFIWDFKNQPVKVPSSLWPMYFGLISPILLIAIYIIYIKVYQHPMVLELSKTPSSLLKLPVDQLEEAKKRLTQVNRLNKVLSDIQVSPDSLQLATSFYQQNTKGRVQLISTRLGVNINNLSQALTSKRNSATYRLKLADNFPLNIDRILLHLPKKTAVEDVFPNLKHHAETQSHITLIIGSDSVYQRKLYNTTRDTSNKWVAPQGSEITRLLLAPDAETVLAEILAGQLSLQQISPYRIGGGVNNESVFFGRRELISQIINRDPANYLMVGGRQVGKSTLLKAIERRYADNPQVECVYLTLSSEVLVPRLASLLKLERTDDAEALATQLDERIRESGQRFVFLIDEADRFISQEKSHDYTILNVFRRLSEEGNCTFILAGFWQLYQHAVLDYQSPIRNFGELLSVGELEKFACAELVTQPMKTMNLSYANETLVEHIVDSCGQRANLIAIVCQHIVRTLPPQQRVIEAGDVAFALKSDEVRRALSGWVLGETDPEQAYERMVVYSTIGMTSFTTGELLTQAKEHDIALDTLELDRTLSRLELAFVLGRKDGSWFYRVPLFVDYILDDSPELKLQAEIKRISNVQINHQTPS